MAATVDHLESHFRVRAIRGFTDAKGIAVAEGVSGVIRMIELDWPGGAFFIDWERDDRNREVERLTFLLAATEGPRNGKMRDYFAKEEFVAPPRAPKPPKPASPPEPERPQRSAAPLDRFAGKQPQEELCLNELTVACDCDPGFHRAIFPAGHLSVHACLRCGAVTVTRQVGDDGRFTGNSWTAYWTVPTPQEQVDWLGQFPRVAINYGGAPWRWPMSSTLVRYPRLLYPHDTRVETLAELGALEDRLWETQSKQTRAAALRVAFTVKPRAPARADDGFAGHHVIVSTLEMRSRSDLDELRARANLISPSSELAADLLIHRDGARDIMMDWLASPDENDFSAGIAMLRDARPLFSGPDDPALAPELLRILDALPLGPLKDAPGRVESCFRFEALLVAIADLGAKSNAMLQGLTDLRAKIGRKDDTVADAIRIVLNELNGIDNRPPEYR